MKLYRLLDVCNKGSTFSTGHFASDDTTTTGSRDYLRASAVPLGIPASDATPVIRRNAPLAPVGI